jgi:hypothetical protein
MNKTLAKRLYGTAKRSNLTFRKYLTEVLEVWASRLDPTLAKDLDDPTDFEREWGWWCDYVDDRPGPLRFVRIVAKMPCECRQDRQPHHARCLPCRARQVLKNENVRPRAI